MKRTIKDMRRQIDYLEQQLAKKQRENEAWTGLASAFYRFVKVHIEQM